MWWLLFAPGAFLFSGRIIWEKTVWTWQRGPQAVGFSLIHIHPGLAILGWLCWLGFALWIFPAGVYAARRWSKREFLDFGLVGAVVLCGIAIILPDTFFA